MAAQILEKILKADKLPSLPSVAMEVMRLMNAEDVDLAKLGKVISNDPALTVSILKMVNSSAFGLGRKVTSLNQAMMLIGLRTVKLMVLSFSLVNIFPAKGSGSFDYPSYWRRSFTISSAARLLSQAQKRPFDEEAFVGGLLADLGMVAAWNCAPALYKPVLEAWADRSRPLVEIEMELLGVSHPRMGRELLMAWRLPEMLCDAIGSHHGEGLEKLGEDSRDLAKVVHAAASIAEVFCKDVDASRLEGCRGRTVELLGIAGQELEGVLGEIDTHVRDSASTYAMEVGETVNYAQLQMEAATKLVQISMQTELQRVDMEKKVSSLEDKAKKADALEKSVKGAAAVQRKLMPQSAPKVPGAQLHFLYNPAELVSGDFFEFVTFTDARTGFLIGDLAGHGVEAGILMGIAKKSLAESLEQCGEVFEALRKANDDLCKNLDHETFLTACLGIYEHKSRNLHLASAGHDPPLIYRPSEDAFAELESAGPMLGVFKGIALEESEPFELLPGDILILMTDGLFECMNAQDQAFGKDRLREIIRRAARQDAAGILNEMEKAARAWRGQRPQKGDITVLGMKIL